MPTPQEVEEMVVRLMADAKPYVDDIKDAVKETEKAEKEIKKHAEEIEKFTKKIERYAQGAIQALGAIGIKDFLEDAFHKFTEAEDGAVRLTAVLEANGRQVQELTDDYNEFAAAMQDVTVLDDDAVLSLLRMAETFDLTGDAAKRAAKDAIALAAVNGDSAESMIRMTAAMQKGNTEQAMQFARMIPQLRGIKDQAEFVARYNKLIEGGMKAASAQAASTSGRIKQLTNAYDNLKEEIGGVVAEGVRPFVDMLKDVVKWFAALSPEMKRTIVLTAVLVAGVLSLAAAISVAGIVFNTLFGGVGILIGVVVAAAVATGVWLSQIGGLEEAWKRVQEGALQVWERVKPVWQKFVDWASTIWDRISSGAMRVWNRIQPPLERLFNWIEKHADELEQLFSIGLVTSLLPMIVVIEAAAAAFEEFVSFVEDTAIPMWEELEEAAEEAWEGVSQGVKDFLDEYGPALRDFKDLVIGYWNAIKTVAVAAWEFVKNTVVRNIKTMIAVVVLWWESVKAVWTNIKNVAQWALRLMGIDAKATWEKIVNGARYVMWGLEFVFKNISTIAKIAWGEVQLGFAHLVNHIEHFFVTFMPALLRWFGTQFVSVFDQMWTYAKNVIKALIEQAKFAADNFGAIVAGRINLDLVFKDIPALKIRVEPFIPPEGPKKTGFMEEMEKQLETWKKELAGTWDDFIRGKMGLNPPVKLPDPIVPPDEAKKAEKDALDIGKGVGGEFDKGIKGELDKVDAALYNSAESIYRVSQYLDRMRESYPKPPNPPGQVGPANLPPVNQMPFQNKLPDEANPVMVEKLRLERQQASDIGAIRKVTEEQARRPVIQIQAANLDG